MTDLSDWLSRNHREIGERDGTRAMLLRREYDAVAAAEVCGPRAFSTARR